MEDKGLVANNIHLQVGIARWLPQVLGDTISKRRIDGWQPSAMSGLDEQGFSDPWPIPRDFSDS